MNKETNRELFEVASLFRENIAKIINGTTKLSLSTQFLAHFCELHESNMLEEASMTSSFHMAINNNKAETIRDLQIIADVFQKSVTLKLIQDMIESDQMVDISRFVNMRFLELNRVKISCVAGIQKLRAQIQKLVCSHSLRSLSEILEKCGADNSSGYSWNDLKEASFTHNELVELDNSLDYSPWMHTLDLSYNLLSDASQISVLCNLKHLNLAYNKFQKVPLFLGSVCVRLQSLILKNNFLEDIEALTALSNIFELDLSDNCLLDHKCLAAISHIATLKTLNLEGNPLSFHPQHRIKSCSYLHKNTATVCFVLDHVVLKKSEKVLIGSLHPIIQRPQLALNNSLTSSITLPSERSKRVRTVTIQEIDTPVVTPTRSPSTFTGHLETKRKIEYLRSSYGLDWLKDESGVQVQDALKLINSCTFLSSTPRSDFDIDGPNSTIRSSSPETGKENSTALTENVYVTASEETLDDKASIISEDEDVEEGDECIYFCNTGEEDKETLLVVTETHISERDCMTSKQRARWHVNTVISCEIVNDEGTQVQLNFDTVRRDRQKRLYTLDENEAQRLVATLKSKMDIHKVEDKLITYQCMKCSLIFSRKNYVYQVSLSCPECESNLIIECNCD